MASSGPELWAAAFSRLRLRDAIVQARPPGSPERGTRRCGASCPAAVGTQGSGHCPAPASAMISAKLLPAPPPPPQAAAAAAIFSLPCTWPCFRAQWPRSAPPASNVRGRRALALVATANTARETPNAPGRRSAPGCWKSLSPLHCHRLFRLPHRAKAAAILARPSTAARGATQAAAAGAASRPHHLKRQERGREPRCGGGLGRRRKAGAELPRWRERREPRRRDAGRAGDGPGLPRVFLHAPSCVRGAACASVAPCVRHQLCSRVRKGRGVRLGPRRAGRVTSWEEAHRRCPCLAGAGS